MRQVAEVLRGRRIAEGVRMLVVPGSEIVKRQAEAEGIDAVVRPGRRRMARIRLFDVHRHEWRPGGARPAGGEHQQPQFRGPPGPGARTLLASPASAAWAAVNGRVADVRELYADVLEVA